MHESYYSDSEEEYTVLMCYSIPSFHFRFSFESNVPAFHRFGVRFWSEGFLVPWVDPLFLAKQNMLRSTHLFLNKISHQLSSEVVHIRFSFSMWYYMFLFNEKQVSFSSSWFRWIEIFSSQREEFVINGSNSTSGDQKCILELFSWISRVFDLYSEIFGILPFVDFRIRETLFMVLETLQEEFQRCHRGLYA